MPKVIVSLSGGMDSATLLGKAVADFGKDEVLPVSFVYPSKHNRHERAMAWEVCKHYGLDRWWPNIDLRQSFSVVKSALLNGGPPIPEGHYEDASMKQTVVPGRNLIFLAHLAALAQSEGIPEVWIGAHAGDRAIYPDCRLPFLVAAEEAVRLSSEDAVKIKAPFVCMVKTEILKLGLELGVPYHLTRTCYSEGAVACGKCGACQERLESFRQCGLEDPLPYVGREIMSK